LVSYSEHLDGLAHVVDVVVVVNEVNASASARWDPPPPPPTITSTTTTESVAETTLPGLVLTIPSGNNAQ
jgi:hypothetical protein